MGKKHPIQYANNFKGKFELVIRAHFNCRTTCRVERTFKITVLSHITCQQQVHILSCIWQFSFLRRKKKIAQKNTKMIYLINSNVRQGSSKAPYRIALKRTKWSQTKACITKSCEICALPRYYYTAQSGNSLPTFQDNLSVPSSRVKQSKREHCTTEANCQNLHFWDFVHPLYF
jgi:hypothetical protein